MKKVLFISNISKRVSSFALSSIEAAKECEIEFHYASNWNMSTKEQRKADEKKFGIKVHNIDFVRNPLSLKNFRAYKQLKELMKKENYDIVHCNTPIGGLLGRICAEKLKVKKIIYMAHGFHFYKGAPFINNIVYKKIEKWLAKKTDAIITINKEDFEASKKFKLKNNNKNYYFVNGIGIDLDRFKDKNIDRMIIRKKLGLFDEDIMAIAMGDLIKRKNYETSIKAIAKLNNNNFHFFICGKGPLEDSLKELSKSLGVSNQIHFLGFRTDIIELLKCSDLFLFTSNQEGLPRSLMEAMAAGLPCIVSDVRGNNDLIKDGEGGYLVNNQEITEITKKIQMAIRSEEKLEKFRRINLKKINNYSLKEVKNQIVKIYLEN